MKKRPLLLAVVSALGLLALDRAGGPAGSIVRFGPLEWSFASTSEPEEATPAPREALSEPEESVS